MDDTQQSQRHDRAKCYIAEETAKARAAHDERLAVVRGEAKAARSKLVSSEKKGRGQ
jgi:hypothetical protein